MGNSLQDQLLALGLAKEKPAKPAAKARPAGHGRGKPAKAGKGKSAASSSARSAGAAKPTADSISLEQAYRIREQEEKTAKQRARERKMEEDRKRAAINKQIRAIVEADRLNVADATEARYFMYKERIRKVYATAEQLARLNDGSLGVVYLAGGYHILGQEQTEAVRQISAEHVADLLSGTSDDEELWAAYEASQAQDAEAEDSEPEEPGDDGPQLTDGPEKS